MDYGRNFLKVCMNIIKDENELSSPAFKKAAMDERRKTHIDLFGGAFKDQGVEALQILAICEQVSESWDNIEVMLNLVGLNGAECGHNWMNTDDLKMGSSATGIGTAGTTT